MFWILDNRFCFNFKHSIWHFFRGKSSVVLSWARYNMDAIETQFNFSIDRLPKHPISKHRDYQKNHENVFGSVSREDLIGDVYVCRRLSPIHCSQLLMQWQMKPYSKKHSRMKWLNHCLNSWKMPSSKRKKTSAWQTSRFLFPLEMLPLITETLDTRKHLDLFYYFM